MLILGVFPVIVSDTRTLRCEKPLEAGHGSEN